MQDGILTMAHPPGAVPPPPSSSGHHSKEPATLSLSSNVMRVTGDAMSGRHLRHEDSNQANSNHAERSPAFFLCTLGVFLIAVTHNNSR